MMSLLEKAIAIAVEAHHGKKDMGGAPYILHPLRVMFRVNTDEEKIVAALHDVVEDHGDVWPMKRLRKAGFSKRILKALDCVTKREGEAYEKYVKRSASNPIALKVKLADLEDNMDVRRYSKVTKKDRDRLNRYLAAYRLLRGL
jgi:(p)ppGpp synthase/HD superfamily hydrolase